MRFYRDWYRPDMAAVVVVGDVDVEATVKEIEKRFSSIPAPKNPKKRENFRITLCDSVRAVTATDPEAPYMSLRFVYKKPHRPTNT
ncbi:MAG: insulinase family protein, partial [Bacteroidia bacterium]|nr:insulinase family protein [Bacteroidia bacterium]